MSRRDRGSTGPGGRIAELLEVGDHRGAALEARRVLADPDASEVARRTAGDALASFRPDPAALAVGAAGVLVAVALTLWTVLGAG
ncbi:hypothetical protein AnaeK_2643 [Anaeromyxobacter sp. K]|uniref:hypothetical protein n=1 Tax=Anaeromyxobacter sp. (strain K) TaxID=447217 RepID=UPI00017BE2AA|nr:hypothetical protein [Anaeromyxobacter sp. K]ACG73868.1 hypothetical protein AnaeK_2643 [Anaeromyxobacter sp. K]